MKKIDKKELIKKLKLKFNNSIVISGTKGTISSSLAGFASDDAIVRLLPDSILDFLTTCNKKYYLGYFECKQQRVSFLRIRQKFK